ncbi:MAG: PRC-barrel domain-containing protein [Gammaproteobacteria bacterium]|nr:MAG: PRC-barrel domain-containing protein [Gammaproteobacteria bacterium]TND01414.1 MAG: PRC-barrel domain-containing protein [Gammaproteobacteria bacterium]
MKNAFISLGFASLALLIIPGQFVYADTATTRGTPVEHPAGDEPMAKVPSLAKQIIYSLPDEGVYFMRMSDFIGATVKNHDGKKIGTINDVVIESYGPFFEKAGASQKATEYRAVISVGGFLGLRDKLIAVPFENLKMQREKNIDILVYPAGKEQLNSLPAFVYPDLQ